MNTCLLKKPLKAVTQRTLRTARNAEEIPKIDNSPPPSPQEQQASLLPSTGQTVTKQSGAITPSSSEYFPTQSAGESVLQVRRNQRKQVQSNQTIQRFS